MRIRSVLMVSAFCLVLGGCASGESSPARPAGTKSVAEVISQSGSIGDIPQCEVAISTAELKSRIEALGGTIVRESDVVLDASFRRTAFTQGVTYPLKDGYCVVEVPEQ